MAKFVARWSLPLVGLVMVTEVSAALWKVDMHPFVTAWSLAILGTVMVMEVVVTLKDWPDL